MVVAFAVLWTVVPYGMFPHDEGQYGQSAVRILGGELPHRDFHEMYSGGLSYWHALLFWLFGEQLIVLRRALVVLAMPAVLAAYAIALRFTASTVLAAIVAVAGIIASVGTMHTVWANLYLGFVSMIIAWLLVRYCDDEQPKWILVAGVLCGVAIAIKITGLYTLAATAVAITFRGTERTGAPGGETGLSDRTGWLERGYRWAVAAAAIAAGPLLVAAHPTANTLAYFTAPTIAIGVALLAAGRRFNSGALLRRHSILFAATTGVVAICLTPWIAAGAIRELYDGIMVQPRTRLAAAHWPPPAMIRCLLAIPLVAATQVFGPCRRWRQFQIGAAVFTPVCCALGILCGNVTSTLAVLDGWRWFPAVGIPLAMAALWRQRGAGDSHNAVYAIHSVTAFSLLNQYPYSIPFYFLFQMPLVMLAMIGNSITAEEAVGARDRALRFRLASIILCIGSFAVALGFRFGRTGFFGASWDSWLDPRPAAISGLAVPESIARPYDEMKALFDENLLASQTILAGPDCPDVYFFTRRRNPTPVVYDIFVSDPFYSKSLAGIASSPLVGAVVINTSPAFAQPWNAEAVAMLAENFGRRKQIGRFLVYYERKYSAAAQRQ